MSEKVFVTGATGHIGSRVVTKLVEANVPTTIFVRDEAKAKKKFEKEIQSGLLSIVIGDYNDEAAFKEGIKGHNRLLLLVADLERMGEIKGKFGRLAFDAGVKQIVDISSFTARHHAKSGAISYAHVTSEEALAKAASETGNSVVHLRGGFFMTNHFNYVYGIKNLNKLFGCSAPEARFSLIDSDDTGDIAVSIFLDPISKHGNQVYDLHPEVLTNKERAEVLSKVLGRTIVYEQQDPLTSYNTLVQYGVSHKMAYDLSSAMDHADPTPQIEILLKRKPGNFEDWVKRNRSAFE